jgi:hypothetical protein
MPNPTAVTSFNLLPPVLRRTIHDAYDDAMETLEARHGCDKWLMYETIRMTVARHIVEQAKHGECDVERLRESALAVVHVES